MITYPYAMLFISLIPEITFHILSFTSETSTLKALLAHALPVNKRPLDWKATQVEIKFSKHTYSPPIRFL